MKVLLINGSPNEKGCTYTALKEIEKQLHLNNINTELVWIKKEAVQGCIACGACSELGKCVFDDIANEIIEKLHNSDGLIVGSPVYYAGVNGSLCAILDRVFYANPYPLEGKPASGIVSCRRGGATASYDRLNKYFGINSMPIVSSQYWNGVHGNTPEEVKQDLEGMQIMRTLGTNMAWMLKAIENQPKPKLEPKVATNFIR